MTQYDKRLMRELPERSGLKHIHLFFQIIRRTAGAIGAQGTVAAYRVVFEAMARGTGRVVDPNTAKVAIERHVASWALPMPELERWRHLAHSDLMRIFIQLAE